MKAMHEDAQLPPWDTADPGGRAAMDSRLQELWLQAIENDPHFPRTLMNLSADLTNLDMVPEMLTSATTFVLNLAIWAYGGRDEAIEQFRANLVALRAIAIKEAQ